VRNGSTAFLVRPIQPDQEKVPPTNLIVSPGRTEVQALPALGDGARLPCLRSGGTRQEVRPGARRTRVHRTGGRTDPAPRLLPLVWSKATRAVGLEGFPFRNLRHTGATLALQEGTNPVLVAFVSDTRRPQ
jgi:integrase